MAAIPPRRVSPDATDLLHDSPPRLATARLWIRQLRVHQWMKNLLLFVPLLTAFVADRALALTAVLAFLAFSGAASATYIFNDLWDLESDRLHPRKRSRPLASGQIAVAPAVAVASLLLAAALGLAWTLGLSFFLLLLLYLVSTTLYSAQLKRYAFLDVVTLSGLYTIRIIAGSAAVGVQTSVWLLAFSVFLFLSLALIKRCTELVTIERAGLDATTGRDYRVDDLVVLWPMGVGAGLCAVVVFALFVSAVGAEGRYQTPELLWLVGMGLICWLGRLWIKTARGEMHDDPLVFALRDGGSRVLIASMVVVTVVARIVDVRWP